MTTTRAVRQRGIALITAVLIVALATIAASAIFTSGNLAIHRASSLQDTEKAWWYVIGVEAWVKTILARDAKQNRTDSLQDLWAQPADVLPVDQGFLRGGVVDLQGRFNLNNFGVENAERLQAYVRQFERLFEQLKLDPTLARSLAQAIRDWADADQNPTPNDGAEDSEYLSLQPPYRSAGRPLQSITELMAIKGMTRDLYTALQPYLCALPVETAVNINTAPEPVLRSLVEKPSSEFESFVNSRLKKPADQISDLGTLSPQDASNSMLTVASAYFQLRAEATIGNSRVAIYSLYYRPQQGTPLVLARSTDSE